jgi:hypothetical protein
MNYLEAINSVLKRLRERPVESVNENEYSTLIGILLNDSKREVEEAWDWSALRNTLTVTTSSGVFNYELNGSQNNIKILDVINDTSNHVMYYKAAHWFTKQYLTGSVAEGTPQYYSFNGVSDDGDTLVDLYPKPNDTFNLRFNVIQRTGDMELEADRLTVPNAPVILLAYAKAVEERGEDNGQTGNTAYLTANKALSDAISLDTLKHPEELDWYSA